MHHHHHNLAYLKNRELDELYVSIALRSFAVSLISIFVPIYLLNQGYQIIDVIFFSIALNFSHILALIPATKFSCRFGFKHSILISIPFLVTFYYMLYSIENWSLLLMGIIYGINNAFYFMGFHLDFTKYSNSKDRGKEVGIVQIISTIFSVLGPVVGGLILSFYGFNILFIISTSLLLLSVVPLFLSKEIHEPFNFNIKDIKNPKFSNDILPYLGAGSETGVTSVFWPIFIYLILDNYTSMGIASSLTFIFAMIFAIYISKIVDKKSKKILNIGAILNSIVWFIRLFITKSLHIFMIDSAKGLTDTSWQVPFAKRSYEKASKNMVEYTIFREFFIQFGRIIMFAIMIFFVDKIHYAFTIGALSSLLFLFF